MRVVMVMPSCAPDSWNDRVRCARSTCRDRRSPRKGDVVGVVERSMP